MVAISIEPLGDSAWLLRFGPTAGTSTGTSNTAVLAAARRIRSSRLDGVLDVVPAWSTLAVCFDPRLLAGGSWSDRAQRLRSTLLELAHESSRPGERDVSREPIEIPVRYGGDDGPDLEAVANHLGLSPAEVITRHSAATYRVAFLGFLPGFPYLEGLDPSLAVPRLGTPRPRVPAGSVGIGGAQTGIYPSASPGGWLLIGRTAVALFDPQRKPPALLQPGDTVLFTVAEAPGSP